MRKYMRALARARQHVLFCARVSHRHKNAHSNYRIAVGTCAACEARKNSSQMEHRDC